jgi:hypothetical protein
MKVNNYLVVLKQDYQVQRYSSGIVQYHLESGSR